MKKRDFYNFKGLIKNKKAEDNLIFSPLIFIVLNIIFFVSLLLFIYMAQTGAIIYEQAYAKQIALIIDEAKPEMEVSVNLEDGIKIAEKNNIAKENIVKINKEENKIIVVLSNGGGYGLQYFSDYEIDFRFQDNYLILNIKEKINKNEK